MLWQQKLIDKMETKNSRVKTTALYTDKEEISRMTE
jgi:hypothetical protein